MRLAALGLMIACSGCSLYFGDSEPPADDRRDPDGPIVAPPPAQPLPLPQPQPDLPCDDPEVPDDDPGVPGPQRCVGPQVTVFGVYETRSDHGAGHHPVGESSVTIDRPGVHTLVLSAYEPTSWHVSLAPGAVVDAVYLYGYHAQTVDLPGVRVVTQTYEQGGQFACGYSYPYNGGGCDTNDLLARVEAEVGPVHAFHGCYRAVTWTLHADDTATSDCATHEGYEQDDLVRACAPASDWEPAAFRTFDPPSCTGARFVRYDARYQAWIGAILCGRAEHYKLYMSERRNAPFLQIADFAGHGQDHCELINPAFTIPDEDDITSGGCTQCSVADLVDVIDSPVYARANFGERFERVRSSYWADLTTTRYACGIAIP
jgi:hypothetical protein